jgi:hypothetical protein
MFQFKDDDVFDSVENLFLMKCETPRPFPSRKAGAPSGQKQLACSRQDRLPSAHGTSSTTTD